MNTASHAREAGAGAALAAVFTGVGRPLEVRRYPVPVPATGEVVLRIEACNVCATDVHAWSGEWDMSSLGGRLPTVLGHEMAGRIHAVGEGVDTDSAGTPVGVGDPVAAAYFRACGRCRACLSGRSTGCQHIWMAMLADADEAPHFVGGFAQYLLLPPGTTFVRVPDGMPMALAATAGCALSQVVYGLDRAGLKHGEQVVIQGAGALGLFAAALARHQGARAVIVVGAVPERLELARELGATATIDIRAESDPRHRARMVRAMTGGGADVVVGVAGVAEALGEALAMAATTGRIVEMGTIDLRARAEIRPGQLVLGNRELIGVSLYEPWALSRAIGFLEATRDQLPYDALTAGPYDLHQVEEAFSDARRRIAIRPVVQPWT